MTSTFFMRDQPTLEHAADHMIRYLATENTQKLPPEVAHLFTQVVPDAQLLKKVGE